MKTTVKMSSRRTMRPQKDGSVSISLLVLITLIFRSGEAFPFLSSSPQRTSTGRSQSISRLYSSKDSVRAGEDGFSVMRQPAKNWDPNVDPEFEVPLQIDESKDSPQQLDDDWWSGKFERKKQTRQEPTSTPAAPGRVIQETTEQQEELDLFQRSLDTLDYPRILRALSKECTTAPARRIVGQAASAHSPKPSKKIPKNQLRAYQLLIADSLQGSQERYRAVEEMTWLMRGLDEEHVYRDRRGFKETMASPPLGGSSFDLEALLEPAVNRGIVLEGPEIMQVTSMMDALENVVCWKEGLLAVEEHEFVELPALANCITVNSTLQELLYNAFEHKNKNAPPRLSGTTFPAIGRLRARVRDLKSSIMSTLDGLLAMPSMKSKLALESGGSAISEVNSGRLVIPVEAKEAAAVGIVHDTSRSGKTVYVEPTEIVGPTNELRQAESELRAEEARIWRYLTEQVLVNRVQLEASCSAAGQLDLVMARVLLGRKLAGVVPLVQDEGVISLHNAKHPVLLLREIENVVGSDVELGVGKNQGLVLTGPNAGGKTVILKLLGLVALMARSGIPVPAAAKEVEYTNGSNDSSVDVYEPRVDFFNPVLADIGDLQSVGGDLSTFSGHMLVCREVLENSGRNALVLMDELGSGTDPAQGVAIAQALLEALVDTGARCAITTHYMQLKQLAAADDRFAVAGMQFVNSRPTYRLLPGTIGESFALAVAERLQLPSAVLKRAEELLDSETRQMGDLIREMEDRKVLVEQQAEELEQKRKELASLEHKMKEEQIRLEKKQLDARRIEARKFAKMLEEKEQILEDILEKLKSDPSRKIVAKSWDDIKFVKRDALNEAENVPSVVARKKKAAAALEETSAELVPIAELRDKPQLKEGDSVVVVKKGALFGREASVIKALSGRVEVRVNNMNLTLKLSQVALPNSKVSIGKSSPPGPKKGDSISKAAEKAIAAERGTREESDSDWLSARPDSATNKAGRGSGGGVTMRTQSNTVDVRGCNLSEAQEKVKQKISSSLMSNNSVVYILHGHGTGGVLKSKIRNWLKSERQLVKKFEPADVSDGGDALTRVDLR